MAEQRTPELIGEYRTNLDSKGRLGLGPFRQQFGESVIAVKMDGYLAVMRPEQFSIISEGIRRRAAIDSPQHVYRLFDRRMQQFKRHFYSNAFEISLDAQGRFTVPAKMREDVKLVSNVIWVGSGDMLELWQAKHYDGREAIWREEHGPEKMVEIFNDVPPPIEHDDDGPASNGEPGQA